ncbi:phosphotransferase family protein [Blastococcus mobilis]|uniref:Predicted kinase, aminoglycoside phosphotransferase (APT) family n=1 Tax=Blastococcus mobilis TaxID=1938746 RepID=A0A238ZCK3_9ACTN|nr:phosphotransferase family protein [Blastococcus mobilis]SNR81245.1 Predicted kinase, aminoglycoside phosphotransferase (APT) family [Blastococcus mobilis]
MTEATAKSELVPTDRLAPALVEATGDPGWSDVRAQLISGGKSNLTFLLTSTAGEMVLRRPPTGALLPSAHDMMREARIQSALAGTPVPTAPIVLADPGGLIGIQCYVMGRVHGHVIRDTMPDGYAVTQEERRALSFGFVDTLAALHQVDQDAVGLGDYGRPTGFMERQVRRWSGQWEKSRTRNVPEVEELGRRLAARIPVQQAATIVHGDYRIDNVVLDSVDPGRVKAVLDWELSTLGDPLADLGMLLLFWRHAGEPDVSSLTPGVTQLPGFPTRADVVERYAAATGTDLGELGFYTAFAHFKFAVIAQGVSVRASAGAMGGQSFGNLDREVQAVAAAGLDLL